MDGQMEWPLATAWSNTVTCALKMNKWESMNEQSLMFTRYITGLWR